MDRAFSSISFITGFATTTDTGDPIAVPFTCWCTLTPNDKKVASKLMDSRLMMSSTIRLVRSVREEFLIYSVQLGWPGSPVAIQANNDIILKNSRVLSFDSVCDLMKSTNAREFLTWYQELCQELGQLIHWWRHKGHDRSQGNFRFEVLWQSII